MGDGDVNPSAPEQAVDKNLAVEVQQLPIRQGRSGKPFKYSYFSEMFFLRKIKAAATVASQHEKLPSAIFNS